jgi:hypothetical protein
MKGVCHRSSRVKAECDRCGRVPVVLHMPEFVHGWYCPKCCPVCREEVPKTPSQEEAQRAAAPVADGPSNPQAEGAPSREH